jgi:hypothetical protein
MNSKFEKVKNFYESGLWNIKRVRDSVEKKWITANDFYEITGGKYEETEEIENEQQ